jgi:hypothetical protein
VSLLLDVRVSAKAWRGGLGRKRAATSLPTECSSHRGASRSKTLCVAAIHEGTFYDGERCTNILAGIKRDSTGWRADDENESHFAAPPSMMKDNADRDGSYPSALLRNTVNHGAHINREIAGRTVRSVVANVFCVDSRISL